ncbi:hypothetical protein M422DRAFT_240099 [Sphaerobolus stellatus SS14]|nr:hypothetical protein M422DRAFT_240099 [Sphaerobolus stellatus SS14]
MTSRLKRKLDNMGVDVQSNSLRMTENFCLIGTPLPPLEKSKDTGEFVPIWKQEVRDEKGRRRLHGAFTGGFSAGYFNTVGSKEGWTPSTFKSSRNDRAKNKQQAKPEDFMDEDDLAEIQESRKLVDTTEETDLFGGTQAELAKRSGEVEKDSVATALEALLPTSKDSVGARLLRKMGWRPGQGIGPRITYQQLRAQEGNPIPPHEILDEEATKHLYAPRDTKPIIYVKKENAFGLGYVPGQGLNEIINKGREEDGGPRISSGFGLGAVNDAEDDDVDVYDVSGLKQHRHMAYDLREVDDDERILLGGKPIPSTSKVQSKTTTTSSATFRDGRPIVAGFVLGEKPLIEDRWFPLPDVPKGWATDPRRVWAADPSAKEGKSEAVLPAPALQEHHIWKQEKKTADERGSMLGEVPLPQAPRSVFDYLSQKDRDRLKTLSNSLASGADLSKPPPVEASIDIPQIDPKIAQAALKGFQPFTTDPVKQLRYTTYLNSQASPDAPPIQPFPGQTNEAFNKELSDFAKAAQIFKPISGAMAGRFASASTVEVIGIQHPGLHKPSKEDYAKSEQAKEQDEKQEEESPKAHAAKMNMFGPLTREVKVWQPARLLSKRFGVKDPYPDGPPSDAPVASTSYAKTDAFQAEVLKSDPIFTAPSADVTETKSASPSAEPAEMKKNRRDLSNIGLGDDEDQGKDTLTYERPAKDIFKAIFASDDEDSDDEEQEDLPEVKPPESKPTDDLMEPVPVPTPSTSKAYEPVSNDAAGKVDLSTFKPTFVPKAERDERKKDKDKKDKKDKKKKGKLVVSFDVEDEMGVGSTEKKKDKERPRKRPKEQKRVDEDDDNMWVEKPPPEIVKDMVIPLSTEPVEETPSHPRGRKRAIDFL